MSERTKPPRLRRCPFCGGKAVLDDDNFFGGPTWNVSCMDDQCGAMTLGSTSQAHAVDAWNRRVK